MERLMILFLALGLVATEREEWRETVLETDVSERWTNEIPPLPEAPTWLQGADIQQLPRLRRPLRLSVWGWSNCGSASDPVQLKTLTLPSTIEVKQPFNVSADTVVAENFQAPIKVVVTLKRHFLAWWVTVPCLEGEVGSCTYQDACQMVPTQNGTCPPIFTDNNIPCRCPVSPAEYKVDNAEVDLASYHIPEGLASGRYKANVLATNGKTGERLICLNIRVKLE